MGKKSKKTASKKTVFVVALIAGILFTGEVVQRTRRVYIENRSPVATATE